MRSITQLICLATAALFLSACQINGLGGDGGLFDDGDGGILSNTETCTDVCTKVESCDGANPPAPTLFGNTGSSGVDAVDCAGACLDVNDRHRHGYANCQIDCIRNVRCSKINDCWNTRSDAYARYCLADREIPPAVDVNDPDVPSPDNDTVTGSEDADDLTEDPAIADAIVDSDLPVNVGNDPPVIAGLYEATGTIDEARGARPVGSPIDTKICFWGQETLVSGTAVNYCEHNVPGVASAPVTGNPENFTIYLTFDMATILFSGGVRAGGDVEEAEALVTYTYGMDMWEHSVTTWRRVGDCNGCP